MKLTTRGKAIAAGLVAVLAAGLYIATGPVGPDGLPVTADAPGLIQHVYICGESLDGLPGTACYWPDDLTFDCTDNGTPEWDCRPAGKDN